MSLIRYIYIHSNRCVSNDKLWLKINIWFASSSVPTSSTYTSIILCTFMIRHIHHTFSSIDSRGGKLLRGKPPFPPPLPPKLSSTLLSYYVDGSYISWICREHFTGWFSWKLTAHTYIYMYTYAPSVSHRLESDGNTSIKVDGSCTVYIVYIMLRVFHFKSHGRNFLRKLLEYTCRAFLWCLVFEFRHRSVVLMFIDNRVICMFFFMLALWFVGTKSII